MAYLIDANVFISASRLHYGLDMCPAFWDWLDHSSATGKVRSIEAVRDELIAGEDALAEWTRLRHELFLSPEPELVATLAEIAQWVTTRSYTPAAQSTFLQATADYYLVAHAKAGNHTVVTHEVPAPDAKKRVKIPDVCIAFGVKHVSPFVMLRREKARFVLGTPSAPDDDGTAA